MVLKEKLRSLDKSKENFLNLILVELFIGGERREKKNKETHSSFLLSFFFPSFVFCF
jgi:hypothetical protein